MRRVVILSHRDIMHDDGGGAPLYIHEIFKRLTHKYHVTIVSVRQQGLPSSERLDGIRIIRLPFRRFPRFIVPISFLARFEKETDILVDNGDIGFPWLTPLYSRKPVIAVIYQMAKDIFRRELGAVPGFVAVKSEHLIYRVYGSHQIITCSPSTRNDLIENGIPSKNIHTVRPGIDEGFLKFQPVGRKFADPTIVCISRFRRYKGLSYAVRAMEYVLDKIPTAKLIIAGNGDERELKHEISRTRYSGSIQILKRAPNQWNDEKRLLLSRSHLLLIPSVREGYGIVVIEANACGTPAIGWAVPGVRDSIVDGKTGLLAPFGDTQALAQTIVKFLSKESTQIAEMSGAAIDWARQHSWETAAKGFAETIDSFV